MFSFPGQFAIQGECQRDSMSIVTVDAHAPHHPVVQVPSNTNPWEWRGNVGNAAAATSESRESYELNDRNRSYRASKSGSVSSDHRQEMPPPLPEVPLDGGRSRESLRRKTPLVVLDQGGPGHTEQDPYYRKLPTGHRFKE